VLFDVGAAVGYYTLLAARLVGPEGHVVAFEPDAKNAGFLRKHIAINRLSNVEVQYSAVGNRTGHASFAPGSGTGTGHLSESGTTSVPICKLDEFVRSGPLPTHLKIDVEGAELEVLEGARKILTTVRPTLFLSTHGSTVRQACCQYLRKLGYHTRPMSTDPKYESEILCAAGPLPGTSASPPLRNAA
jgi:FkbM family methyltransferase